MTKRNPTRARTPKHAPRATTPTIAWPPHLRPKAGRAVSLRLELGEVRAVITGARMIADAVAHGGLENADDFRAAPSACGAVLAMAVERLLTIDRVLAGDVGARALGTRNLVAAHQVPDNDDVLLPLDRDAGRSAKKLGRR